MDIGNEFIQAIIASGTDRALGGIVALGKKVAPALWSALSTKGKKQFEVNLKNFGDRLMSEVRQRVQAGGLSKEQIAAALDQPDLVSLVISTLAQAAQTSDTEKQKLLAKLVAERLGCNTDSELALVTPMASEAITRLNAQHLKLLALRYILASQRYDETANTESGSEDTRRLREVEWVIGTFEPYQDFVASVHDAEHLVAVGCAGGLEGFLADELKSALTRMVSPDLDLDMLAKTETWCHLETVWNNGRLAGMRLTSVGSLVGMYTSDILAKRPTEVSKWLNRSST